MHMQTKLYLVRDIRLNAYDDVCRRNVTLLINTIREVDQSQRIFEENQWWSDTAEMKDTREASGLKKMLRKIQLGFVTWPDFYFSRSSLNYFYYVLVTTLYIFLAGKKREKWMDAASKSVLCMYYCYTLFVAVNCTSVEYRRRKMSHTSFIFFS